MAQFKLLVGLHITADPDSPALTPEQVKAGARRPSKTYKEGDIVESDSDLVAKHGAAKFVLLSGAPAKAPSAAEEKEEVEEKLQRMNLQQLKMFAQEKGIDLSGKTTKAEIVEHVLAVLSD